MIKNLLKKYKKNHLVRDNVTLFLSNLLMGLFVFLYHFYMGRVLGPALYSVIGVIQSIVYIFNIPLTAVQTGIAKFTSGFKIKNKFGEIKYLFKSSLKKLVIFGIIGMVLFIAVSSLIASYLKIEFKLLLMLSPFVVFILIVAMERGMLQGLQKFKGFGVNLITEGSSKLFLGVILVLIGLSVSGAITAIILSYIAALLVGYYALKRILRKEKEKKFNTKEVYKYSIPVILVLIGLTAMYTIDVLLVKHFFPDVEAGHYAAVATLGKILFFGTYSITQVMFPKVSEYYHKKKPYKHLLYKSLLMMLAFLTPITIIYFLFSKIIIKLVYGSAYLDVAGLLGWFAVVMGLFSLIYTISFYNLSINKTKFLYLLFLYNVVEIILIYLFHETLLQVVTILLILMLSLFIIMFLQAIFSKDGKTINNNTSAQ